MKKDFKGYFGIWAVLFVLFNLACFATPNEVAGFYKFGGAFWSGYIFIILAFIGQLAVSYYAFQPKDKQKFFYRVSLIKKSWKGLILTLIFGTVCMVIPDLPNWIGAAVCGIILGFNILALTKANASVDMVSEMDDKVKEETKFIKKMVAEAEHLMKDAKSSELKSEAKKVFEALRYSDPMSHTELAETEDKIEKAFTEFADAINKENLEEASAICKEIISLIDLRNKKCKALK